jgi:hypothetical protein
MREVGFYRFAEDSDAWAAKAYRVERDGSMYIFANDQARGFDVFRYDSAVKAHAQGRWLSAAPGNVVSAVDAINHRGPSGKPWCLLVK